MAFNFKHRISFMEEIPNPGPDPGTSLQEVKKAWADIKTMKGSEFNTATMAGNLGVSRFIIKYTPGITSRMHIRFKGKDYSIRSIMNDDEQNRTITIIGEAIL
ncbi:phage head closure protein [Alkalicoccus saliphilus]|uniref:Head-tail adaptor protein n=1 Tax=Alkalicoccus saliphilus TaxID=200989 RepID=A0A2T4U2M7_9BACI|nr:phage head closure protein [Alkalicoccus saliphilus]PTL37649.1 head-tail adaptor protein [Alkalicoccus saliphilus]